MVGDKENWKFEIFFKYFWGSCLLLNFLCFVYGFLFSYVGFLIYEVYFGSFNGFIFYIGWINFFFYGDGFLVYRF